MPSFALTSTRRAFVLWQRQKHLLDGDLEEDLNLLESGTRSQK